MTLLSAFAQTLYVMKEHIQFGNAISHLLSLLLLYFGEFNEFWLMFLVVCIFLSDANEKVKLRVIYVG